MTFGTVHAYKEYQVVGRHVPTEKDPNPKIYRMRIFAKSAIIAKSRYWYFLSQFKKVKRATGQILAVTQINEKHPFNVKNYGIFLRYNSRTGTHNIYKEYRDVSRVGAVQQLYCDMAGQYRARFREIQIISVDVIAAKECRRAANQQFHNEQIKFPLPHRTFMLDKNRSKFAYKRPSTYFK
eukprot:TRINITY_DN1611_c0_g2_i1.p1 TRINITY_DN1611_c0_g2~~TRINITY_DN1611_c0_g2_i1.p1  ORF type:complete len:181 (-),score=39.30 TRINITY_DN1611_c0_g2_i1:728-1270(-)